MDTPWIPFQADTLEGSITGEVMATPRSLEFRFPDPIEYGFSGIGTPRGLDDLLRRNLEVMQDMFSTLPQSLTADKGLGIRIEPRTRKSVALLAGHSASETLAAAVAELFARRFHELSK